MHQRDHTVGHRIEHGIVKGAERQTIDQKRHVTRQSTQDAHRLGAFFLIGKWKGSRQSDRCQRHAARHRFRNHAAVITITAGLAGEVARYGKGGAHSESALVRRARDMRFMQCHSDFDDPF